jgi:hypothetical protein
MGHYPTRFSKKPPILSNIYMQTLIHHLTQKLGIISTLATKSLKLFVRSHLEQERDHLLHVFKNNGYKKSQEKEIIQKTTTQPWNRDQDIIAKVILLYIQGMIDKIAKILKNNNITIAFNLQITSKG